MERAPALPSISRAIRRSRDARQTLRARGRKRTAAIIGLPLLALSAALTLSFAAFPDSEVVQAAATRAQSLVDLLSQRSPGPRTQGDLTKTKRARRAATEHKEGTIPALPRHHAATALLAPEGPSIIDIVAPPSTLALVDLGPPIAQLDGGPPPSLGSILGPSPGGGTNPSITPPESPGSPVTNPSLPPEPLETLTPAVPEPGTWAMMILGFGFVGWRLRRAKAAGQKTLRA
jgi:hypothetical protein